MNDMNDEANDEKLGIFLKSPYTFCVVDSIYFDIRYFEMRVRFHSLLKSWKSNFLFFIDQQ